ncbi:hypothetical protein [Microbacterium murale]|uniref:hypothetical protein n=1 Tax=Microbacterium murale TaxID=1081040 RepID=UPI0027D8BEE1|nr:hypothetical protein [Microbacterium murale]
MPIIESLDIYGGMGRFYYLDELGDAPQLVSPNDSWQSIEQAVLTDPAVATLYQQAMNDVGDNDAWETFIRALHERSRCANETVRWGEIGGTFGFEVHPGREDRAVNDSFMVRPSSGPSASLARVRSQQD